MLNSSMPVVVTVSPRDREIHRRTFSAARGAGFNDLYATCEPGTDTNWIDATRMLNRTRFGQWRNFIEALRIGIGTWEDYFMTLEDDVELCRGTSELLRQTGWPADDCGCLQLYSAEPLNVYPVGRRSKLDVIHVLDMLGACALVFRRDAAITLVEWADTNGWRGHAVGIIDDPVNKIAADTFVGEVLHFSRFSIWIHNPSLSNHIGNKSTLGHDKWDHDQVIGPNRKPLNFPGVDADLKKIFSEELKCV